VSCISCTSEERHDEHHRELTVAKKPVQQLFDFSRRPEDSPDVKAPHPVDLFWWLRRGRWITRRLSSLRPAVLIVPVMGDTESDCRRDFLAPLCRREPIIFHRNHFA
jgi:hypothetical protein